MIDLHCHVLPGIDDGPASMEESVALARVAAAAGIRTLVATPHVSWEYFNDSQTIARLAVDVNERLVAANIPVHVLTGAELAATKAADLSDEQLTSLRLGGGPWLLVECPLTPVTTGFETLLGTLQARGHAIVLAHPERSAGLRRDPNTVGRLIEAGMLTSITAGALVGRFGRDVRGFAHRLVEAGMVHSVTSDAHDAQRRPPSLVAEMTECGLGALTEWATQTVPSAILSGAPIPPRPVAASRDAAGHWWQRASRRGG